MCYEDDRVHFCKGGLETASYVRKLGSQGDRKVSEGWKTKQQAQARSSFSGKNVHSTDDVGCATEDFERRRVTRTLVTKTCFMLLG